jgi:hypothetical protein
MELKVKMLWLFTEVLLGRSRSRIPGSSRRFADKWNHGFYRGLTPLRVACGLDSHCAIGLCYPCEGAAADRPQRKPTTELENDASPATVFTASPAVVGIFISPRRSGRLKTKGAAMLSSSFAVSALANSLFVARTAVKTYQLTSKVPRVGSSYNSSTLLATMPGAHTSRASLTTGFPVRDVLESFNGWDTLQWRVVMRPPSYPSPPFHAPESPQLTTTRQWFSSARRCTY